MKKSHFTECKLIFADFCSLDPFNVRDDVELSWYLGFLATQGPSYTFLAFRYPQKHHKVEVARALVAAFPSVAGLLSKDNAIVSKKRLKDLEEFHLIEEIFKFFMLFSTNAL